MFCLTTVHFAQRINVREKIVGFYSSGPLIKPSDLDIADLVSNYCKKPVFAIIDIRADREEEGLPVKAYSTIEKVRWHSVLEIRC